jgi:Spy/CpxP family protein refolding chaperone
MPHGKWWRSPRAVKQLDLTEEEKGKLDDKFVESRRRLIDLKSNVERERFEVDNLLDSEVLNEDAVREQFKKLEAARGALSAERFNFLLEVRQILGFERFQKVKALSELRRHKKARKGDRAGLKREDFREMALGGPPRH